jgi:tetratricopeptide (TPR) repeat protein
MIDTRLGEGERALQYAVTLRNLEPPPAAGPIDRALALGIEARNPAGRLDPPARLALVEQARLQQPYQYNMASPFYSQTLDRFLHAELAAALGRNEEALWWFGSFNAISTHDLVFLAPAHLRSARIHEQMDDREQAIAHYRRFVTLWRDCDMELRPLVDDALQRIEELSAESAE